MQVEPIKITGLAEFRRNLKRLDGESGKALRRAHNFAAQLVVDGARGEVPQVSGRAAKSLRVSSTQAYSRASGGNARSAPYYPWLDFGGRVGRRGRTHRPFDSSGRYLYPTYANRRDDVQARLAKELIDVARAAGLGLDSGQ